MLQDDSLAALSTVIVAPTSQGVRPASFRPEVVIGDSPTRVLVEQLAAVDPGRLGAPVGHLDRWELRRVERALLQVLGLTEQAG